MADPPGCLLGTLEAHLGARDPMPIAHACFVLDRVRMAGPSYAGLGSGSGLVGEGSSELGSELQNCWVAFEHAGDGGCFFGEPSALSVRSSRMVKQGCSPFPCPPLVDSSPPRGGTRWMGKSGGPWDTSGASGGPR